MNKYLKIMAVPVWVLTWYASTFAAAIDVNQLENKITLLGSWSDNIGQSFRDLVFGRAAVPGGAAAVTGIYPIVIDVLPYFLWVAALIIAAPKVKWALMTVFNKVMWMVWKRSA